MLALPLSFHDGKPEPSSILWPLNSWRSYPPTPEDLVESGLREYPGSTTVNADGEARIPVCAQCRTDFFAMGGHDTEAKTVEEFTNAATGYNVKQGIPVTSVYRIVYKSVY